MVLRRREKHRPCTQWEWDTLERPGSFHHSSPRINISSNRHHNSRWEGVARTPFHRYCRTIHRHQGRCNLELERGRGRDRHWTQDTSNTVKGRGETHLGRRKKKRAVEDRQPREQAITTDEP